MTQISDPRRAAGEIFARTLRAIDVEATTRAALRVSDGMLRAGEDVCRLDEFANVLVIGIGKASVPMARGVEAALGDRLTDGLVVTNAIVGDAPARLPVWIGGHPLPNVESMESAASALAMLHEYDREDTLVLFLMTGGGSAMFERPIDDRLTLEDLQGVNRALVGCGAVINEMNIVRRWLSAVKGGKLAAAAPRARQISLYISDVNSDDLTTVASGPTLPDGSTREDFERILDRYGLLDRFPPAVSALIRAGGVQNATPPPPGARRSHHLLLDNRRALDEARRIAESEYGLLVEIAEDLVEGDVEQFAVEHLRRIEALRVRHPGRAVCLLSGGEVICPVRGTGQGGRNLEFVLRAAMHLDRPDAANIAVLSAGTDGIDGNSPAAGAVADRATLARARDAGLSAEAFLLNSDSYAFFSALDDALLPGPTGNNVRDLRLLIASA